MGKFQPIGIEYFDFNIDFWCSLDGLQIDAKVFKEPLSSTKFVSSSLAKIEDLC